MLGVTLYLLFSLTGLAITFTLFVYLIHRASVRKPKSKAFEQRSVPYEIDRYHLPTSV